MNIEKIKHDLRKQMIKHDQGLVTDENLALQMLRKLPPMRKELISKAIRGGSARNKAWEWLYDTYYLTLQKFDKNPEEKQCQC